MAETQSPILCFHAGSGTDDLGRRVADILAWDDLRLERVHDYIQWLFPLPERSAFNAGAPVLTGADIEAFRERDDLRAALRRALERMLAFYGFALETGPAGAPEVVRTRDYAAQTANWLTPGNHNFLRISRILRSLALLGLGVEARAFLAALEAVYAENGDVIGPVTRDYWRRAAMP
jgi:hypothetical protein